MAKAIETAFPPQIAQRYPSALNSHRLRREIVATQIANDMVNNMGITFAQRLIESTGATPGDVAKAYVAARDIYQLEKFVQDLKALDHQVPAPLQHELMINMMRRVRRATRWFLRNRRSNIDPAAEVGLFSPAVNFITQKLPDFLQGIHLEELQAQYQKLQEQGVARALAVQAAPVPYLYSGISLAEAVKRSGCDIELVSKTYFAISNYLSLPWFANQLSQLKVESFWQAMARETYMDDLESQLRSLTVSLLKNTGPAADVNLLLTRWSNQQQVLVNRWRAMVAELQANASADFAVFSVALRDLLDVAQATQHVDTI
jgi:glutamate dehydrogenase